MKSLYWMCFFISLLWIYPPITYSLSPEEERARELLRSQLEPGKKAKKGNSDHRDNKTPTEPIQPFGPFSWEDNFLTAVLKANSLPGVETVSLDDLDLREIRTNEQLQKLLGDYLSKSFPKTDLDTLKSLEIIGEYVDGNGRRALYYSEAINIHVYPVVIAGVPFRLTVSLSSTPGLSIASADKVPSTLTSTQDITTPISVAFPKILGGVSLWSDSPALSQKLPEIERLLEEKYRKYDPAHHHVMEWKDGGTLHDPTTKNATRLTINGPYPLSFEYESFAFGLVLNQKYVEHLANLESGKFRDKVDLKGGL